MADASGHQDGGAVIYSHNWYDIGRRECERPSAEGLNQIS